MPVDMDMVGVRQWAFERSHGDLARADALARWASIGDMSEVAPAPAPAVAVPRKLGRLAPRPGMRARVPHLSEVAPALPPPPDRDTSYVERVSGWILGENDQLGDCTCVCAANIILGLSTLAGQPRRLADADIVAFYETVGGYQPGDPATDNGAVIEDVLTAWRTQGIAGDRLDGFASITPSNHQHVMQAIAFLGPVDLGVTLPSGWMSASTWDVSTAATGIAGGHCIAAVGYTSDGPLIVSWGQLYTLTWAGWDAYVDEAHVLLSRDALTAAGKSPDGVDWTALGQRMQAMEAA